jgi:hypothetical protein
MSLRRTSFLTASAALVAAGTASAQANVPGGTQFVERKTNFAIDEFARIVGRPAQIRQLYEAVAFKPAIFNNIKNSFNGLQFGFGYPADAIVVAMANHGPSAAFGYSDYLWQKYRIGEFFSLKDAAGAPVTSNVFLAKRAAVDASANPDDEKGMYQDASIEMLQQRGLVMLTCHTAAEEQAQLFVKRGFAPAGMTPTQVANDILTHLIPAAVVVPSMVATIAVLQATYHYTYISPAF